MKRFAISTLACTCALAAISLTGCKKDKEIPPAPTAPAPTAQKSTFYIEFEQTVDDDPLVLASQTYSTPAGDQFKVTMFRQYISNIKLTRADGSQYVQPESYYLIDAAVPASQHIAIKDVPVGDYTGITFTIGVDSARNVSGAQTGALDTNNNMFWAWNSGYIYTKLEGTSPQASKPPGATEGGLIFHIGGFKSPNNTIRTVSPAFPSNTKMLVRTDHSPEIHMNVNIMKMFVGPNPIRFATLSSTMGGPKSVLVADNYAAGMFSIEHIHAN